MKTLILFLISFPALAWQTPQENAYYEYQRQQYQRALQQNYYQQIIENQRKQIMLQQLDLYDRQQREQNPCFGKGFGCINSHRDWSYR